MSLADFIILSKLGEGSFGQVFRVRRISDSNIYALKKVKVGTLSEKDLQNSLNQIRILASINHENIIQYKQAFYDAQSRSICIIMQYAENGDLQARIASAIQRRAHIPQSEVWSTAYDILSALKQLQDNKIMHRDIKTANIFYKGSTAKLGDMNVSKVTEASLAYTQTGTPYYASPEVWREQPYSYKSDIWSLGCVLFEMCALKPPFRARNLDELFKRVQSGYYDKIPALYSSALSNFIAECIVVDVRRRGSAESLLEICRLHLHKQPLLPSPRSKQKQLSHSNSELIKTIKPPKNLVELNSMLPSSTYEQTPSQITRPASSKNISLRKSLSRNDILEQFMKQNQQMSVQPQQQHQPTQRRASIQPRHRILRHIASEKLIPLCPEKLIRNPEPCSVKVLPEPEDSFKQAVRADTPLLDKDVRERLQKIDMRRKQRYERQKQYLQVLCQRNRKSTPGLSILPPIYTRPLRIQ